MDKNVVRTYIVGTGVDESFARQLYNFMSWHGYNPLELTIGLDYYPHHINALERATVIMPVVTPNTKGDPVVKRAFEYGLNHMVWFQGGTGLAKVVVPVYVGMDTTEYTGSLLTISVDKLFGDTADRIHFHKVMHQAEFYLRNGFLDPIE